MLVSVVIPAKNEEANIGPLLKQLNEQSFQDREVIVADARSTDRTREIARSLGAVVVQGGLPGAGRNLGAQAANGDIFLFLDADAVLPSKHFLRDLLREMRRRQFDIASVDVKPYKGTAIQHLTYALYNRYVRLAGRHLPHAVGTCMFAKRYIHEAIGGFDETITLAEDMHYARQAAQLGEFGILRSHPILTPMRRWEKDGWLPTVSKYIYTEVHMVTKGPVRGNITYDFDYMQDSQSDSQ